MKTEICLPRHDISNSIKLIKPVSLLMTFDIWTKRTWPTNSYCTCFYIPSFLFIFFSFFIFSFVTLVKSHIELMQTNMKNVWRFVHISYTRILRVYVNIDGVTLLFVTLVKTPKVDAEKYVECLEICTYQLHESTTCLCKYRWG